ncbi:acyltransferase family protein [Sphingomonas aerophila]|uniref:Peptidoglycan/LPS O-acetylase OafA/YrhL n=1 Tax=Sphingomonas aerophila TaxID=1344948 RepID=A0A7W9BC62_9SPHN|nr:acyltransferase [Sphingomonas aerophila]MBB5714314.1 peptidoglycan/LPS O-acetylase OafA/YrhL [Sphingomonas aerophila]
MAADQASAIPGGFSPSQTTEPAPLADAPLADAIAASRFNAAAHGLRGIAAFLVLCAHILGGTARHIYASDTAYVAAVKPAWYLGTFGVQLFFIISGFVILPSAIRYKPEEFALRRALRIYPLFFVLSLLFILLNAHTNAYPDINSATAIISGLLFLNLFTGTEQLTPNAWSLSFEVMFYALTCAIVHFGVRHRRRLPAAVAIAAAAIFIAAFPIALYFVAGVVIRILYSRRPGTAAAPRWELASLALMIGFASRGHFEYRWSDFANPVLVPIMLSSWAYFYFAVAPGSLTSRLGRNRFVAYTGTVSYSLYLVHPYVYLGLRKIFAANGLFTEHSAVSVMIFAVPVILLSFAAAHWVNRGLEQWPYRWFFHQQVYRTRKGAPGKTEPMLVERRA